MEDIRVVSMNEEHAKKMVGWRQMFHFDPPYREKLKDKRACQKIVIHSYRKDYNSRYRQLSATVSQQQM